MVTITDSYATQEMLRNDPSVWVSHVSGRSRKISDMIDEHILFAIKMIERGRDVNGVVVPDWCKNKVPALVIEAGKRGILGQYSHGTDDGWDA